MSAQVSTTAAVAEKSVGKAKGKPIGPAPYLHEDLILVRATVPEIIQRTWTNNMEEWAKGVPLPQYHAREKHLASTAFSSDNRLITWVLVPKPDADVTDAYKEWVSNASSSAGTGGGAIVGVSGGFDPSDISEENLERILGAVETYERPGIVANVGDEELKDVSSMSVASVYAPSKYRNHGYGKLTMKLLWQEIERMGASFTFLYSDLGAQFYTNFGWTARKSTEIVIPSTFEIPVIAITEDSSDSHNNNNEPHKPITRASAKPVALEAVTDNSDGDDGRSILKTLVDRDAQLLRQSLKQKIRHLHQEDPQKTTLVAVTPEIRSFQWLYARAWFNATEICKFKEPGFSIKKDLNYGVYVPGRDDQFVLWHHDFTDDNLFILRWRIDESDHMTNPDSHLTNDAIALAFAKAAQQEAKKWKLSKIVYWNGDASLARLLGLKVEERNHSIPSLGLVNSQQDPQSVEWILNEKYSWC